MEFRCWRNFIRIVKKTHNPEYMKLANLHSGNFFCLFVLVHEWLNLLIVTLTHKRFLLPDRQSFIFVVQSLSIGLDYGRLTGKGSPPFFQEARDKLLSDTPISSSFFLVQSSPFLLYSVFRKKEKKFLFRPFFKKNFKLHSYSCFSIL